MAEQRHRIVGADESEIHDEPHITGSRITVRFVHERVETAGVAPETFAERHSLDLAAVYHALAYYHDHPAEMRQIDRDREERVSEHRDQVISGPDDLY